MSLHEIFFLSESDDPNKDLFGAQTEKLACCSDVTWKLENVEISRLDCHMC